MPANPAHFYKLGGPNTRKVADGFLSIAPFCVRVHTWAAYLANREECVKILHYLLICPDIRRWAFFVGLLATSRPSGPAGA